MMIQKKIADSVIQEFRQVYAEFIHSEREDRIYMKCIWGGHADNDKVRAVLYKENGVYTCPVHGSCHISTLLSGVEVKFSYRKLVERNLVLSWNFTKHPLHYYITSTGHTLFCNATEEGSVLGLGERTADTPRRYKQQGKAGFRLFAPVLTESFSEAVLLLEMGIDAGSICGVTNWRNIKSKIYIPQNDDPGKAVIQKLPHTTLSLNWFLTNPTCKDIRDLEDKTFIIDALKSFRIVL